MESGTRRRSLRSWHWRSRRSSACSASFPGMASSSLLRSPRSPTSAPSTRLRVRRMLELRALRTDQPQRPKHTRDLARSRFQERTPPARGCPCFRRPTHRPDRPFRISTSDLRRSRLLTRQILRSSATRVRPNLQRRSTAARVACPEPPQQTWPPRPKQRALPLPVPRGPHEHRLQALPLPAARAPPARLPRT